MIGTRLGHFEIQAKIGEGGMGAVYRAKDLHLGRAVALKVLPPAMTAVPERKARFIQEAKAASSLQHPNIVSIFEIGAQDGVDFMAMELVEGKTLAELIPRGSGMNPSEAVRIASQLTDGLAKAHGAKIIHRDLKPANVMVSADGHVKILDFGLAKLLQPDPVSQDDDTVTIQTKAGAIMGTIAYMSPEQAEGRTLDARSDIFSFGATLYEMLTGRRAFRGDTQAGTLAAVMRDPVEMSGVPTNLAGVVSRCLQKDRDRRFQTMADVRAALLDAGAAAPKPIARPRWIGPAAVAAVLAAGALAGMLWWRSLDRLPPMQVLPLTTDAGTEASPTFSPDGTQVAYTWDGGKPQDSQIYVRVVGSPSALQLTTGPGQSTFPSWSPDGRQIAYQAQRNGIWGVYLISRLGGQERRIGNASAQLLGQSGQLSWTPDGKHLAFARSYDDLNPEPESGAIILLPVDGGDTKTLLSPKQGERFQDPDFHPSEPRLAFVACQGATGSARCQAQVVDLNSDWSVRGAPKTVVPATNWLRGTRWASDGESLLYSALYPEERLFRVGIGGGEPLRLDLAGLGASRPVEARHGHRAAYVYLMSNQDVLIMDERGLSRPLLASSLIDASARFSPDGTRIAFATARGGAKQEIWLANADGSGLMPLTNSKEIDKGSPNWSPDGKWVAYDAQDPATGIWQIWMVESAGGTARQLTTMPKGAVVPVWSRDGQSIYFCSESTGQSEIYRMPAKGGAAQRVTQAGGKVAQESPDGKTLYYTKSISKSRLYAMPVGGGPEKEIMGLSSTRGFQVFNDGVYHLMAVGGGKTEVRFVDFASGKTRVIGAFDSTRASYLSVSPDRKAFLFDCFTRIGSDLMLIENFR